jgi:hypothetical protein
MRWMLDDSSRGQALHYLEFWLSSIYLHTQNDKGATCAPILLVGTHKDMVSEREQHEAISAAIRGRFEEAMASTAWPAVVEFEDQDLCFFPVNNRIGHSDPAIPAVLQTVEELAGQADYTRMEVPFAWLRCYDAMRRQDRKVLSLAEATAIADGCGLPVSSRLGLEKETLLFLGFFHKLGKLMHFQEASLVDFVILRPFEFLIAPATVVICDHGMHQLPAHKRARTMAREWALLTDTATLSRRLLDVLWRDFAADPVEVRLLLDLMVKFGLAIPLRQAHSVCASKGGIFPKASPAGTDEDEVEGRHLIPALLREEALSPVPDGNLVFCVVFSTDRRLTKDGSLRADDVSNRFMPIGFFPRLLGKCVSWSQYTGGMPPALSKRQAALSFGAQTFLLQELPALRGVRVSVAGRSPREIRMRVELLVQEVIQECMPNLRSFVVVPLGARGTPPPGTPSGPKMHGEGNEAGRDAVPD